MRNIELCLKKGGTTAEMSSFRYAVANWNVADLPEGKSFSLYRKDRTINAGETL